MQIRSTWRPWVRPHELVYLIEDAKKCLRCACRMLGLPMFTPHDSRHLFATVCTESSVDILTISRWLGHQDGGVLAMRFSGTCARSTALT